jgi:hypothetical protein
MKYFLILLIIICALSCSKKVEENKPLIEIYELNRRIPSYEGQPFHFTDEMLEMEPGFIQVKDIMRMTDDSLWTPNGAFRVPSTDLKEAPLVTNEQIIGFNFKTGELDLTKEACTNFTMVKTIKDPFPDVQLVITANKKPILNFYKAGTMSRWNVGRSYFVTSINEWIGIKKEGEFDPKIHVKKSNLKIYKGSFREHWLKELPNLKQDTLFYNAFKRADKIIAE